MPDPLEELGPLVGDRRAELKLSLREASAESGVPPATLARIEQGRMPDLETFRRLIEWLGLPPDRFFADRPRTEYTPDTIVEHLRRDPTLSPAAVEQMEQVMRSMYDVLVTQDRQLAVHLRAAKTFTPAALSVLTELLDELQGELEHRDAS